VLELRGRVAVVTGAAGGLGAALADRLHAEGARLVLADVDADALAGIADRLGAVAVETDVADADAVQRLAGVAGPPALLCLNAGIVGAETGPAWETTPAEWDRVLAVNLGGVVNGLRAFVPGMLAAEARSHVLVTASLAGLLTWPGGGAYAASKHAVVAVAEQTALSLADTGVGVTLLCPALVRTGMSEIGDDPADVAALAIAAVHDGRFAVFPEEWATSLAERARRTTAGEAPVLPMPD
jgi:NAD(P)-dependent dehydrogenase (short-subunit alcohol dehydrogenase family)